MTLYSPGGIPTCKQCDHCSSMPFQGTNCMDTANSPQWYRDTATLHMPGDTSVRC